MLHALSDDVVYAAQSGHPAFRWGDLWEWTGSPFAPYPGFSADAYREYSAPYFGTHQAVRGASFATPARLRAASFRNFYAPQRNDFFAGFRTCALSVQTTGPCPAATMPASLGPGKQAIMDA